MPNILAIAGPNSKYKRDGATPAGFWAGFWHGVIAPVAFVVSLLNPNVRIYEIHNRGRRYDLGFLIGFSISLGGGGAEVTRQSGPPPVAV